MLFAAACGPAVKVEATFEDRTNKKRYRASLIVAYKIVTGVLRFESVTSPYFILQE